MPRVFIETTIPSYYFETRTDRRSQDWRAQTRLCWDKFRGGYELVTGDLVLAEFALAPESKHRQAAAFISELRVLAPPKDFVTIVAHYIDNKIMPADAGGDAAHLALASLHACDFLLTWNCRHLANANKQQHIRIINARLGLATPTITTPFELIPPE
jgi:hypothetical protein